MVRNVNEDFGDYEDEDEHDPDLIMDDQMEAQLEDNGFSVEAGLTHNLEGADVAATGEPYVDYSNLYDKIDVHKRNQRESTDDNEDHH